MDAASREERDRILAELYAARDKLAELEKKANVSGYKSMWWITKRQYTEEERKLFGEKHFDDLPGSSLPEGIRVEKNVPIEISDGVKLAANVFRPDKPGRFPVIMAFTPFSKDYYGQHDPFGCSEMTPFEGPDPGFWVPSGYAMVHVDERGTGRSPGMGTGGAYDFYDGIEWAGEQEWSNGNVGMLGHSALAMRQWEVASMEEPPPHLKAIIPWGGYTDWARENKYLGGIPETEFRAGQGENLPLWQKDFQPKERPRLSRYLQPAPSVRSNPPKLENIKVPMLVGSTWIDYYAHLQGTMRSWLRASSKYKWLYTYSLRKWQGLYTPMEARDMQRKFFDYFLKGNHSGIMETPRVRLSIQDKLLDYKIRYEKGFPIPRTVYTKYYLDARDSSLGSTEPEEEASVSYDSSVSPVTQVLSRENKVGPEGKASFRVTFSKETELIGFFKLKLWASPQDADDMDLFVTLRKYNADGHEVCFDCDVAPGRAPVARGWMRLSKRQLDEQQSREWLPVQKSVTPDGPEQKVKPGEIVPCEITIWPASVVFHAGEKLAVDISGKYGVKDDLMKGFNNLINSGRHTIFTGGKYDSYLLAPLIPEARSYGVYGGRKVAED